MSPTLQADIARLLEIAESDVAASNMVVPAAKHLELARLLKSAGYTMYVTVVASHWPAEGPSKQALEGSPERFEVATVLRKPEKGAPVFTWRVKLQPDEPIDTLYSLFAGADWQEREQFDLVGVRFRGHPDLRRLMLPEDWEGHPLRRDYAIDTPHHPWR